MKQISQSFQIPAGSIIGLNFLEIDYCDSYSMTINASESVDLILNRLFESPPWVDLLLKIRNSIVSVIGLNTNMSRNVSEYYPVGSKADLFTVLNRNEHEIVMGENDKHLLFRTSVFTEKINENQMVVSQITIVHYHNWFGRFYFFFVKPFHQLILKAGIKKAFKSYKK